LKICRAGYRDARRRCVAGVTLPEIRDPAPGLSKRDTPKAKVEIGTRRSHELPHALIRFLRSLESGDNTLQLAP